MSRSTMLLLPLLVGFLYFVDNSLACNEAVCASLVSKCMLMKSCECNMMDKDNCTCCKECHQCLSKLYTDCCSCVGMCPDQDPSETLSKTSSVEELTDPIPGLFKVLTDEQDPELRWTTYNYPAHLDLLYFKPTGTSNAFEFSTDLGGKGHHVKYGDHHVILDPESQVQNCTVAYMSQCMSLTKCKASCRSMGAARYRWFHDFGCCECIGSTCLQFGKAESLCMKCPEEEEEEENVYIYYEDEKEIEIEEDEEELDEINVEDTEDFILTDGGMGIDSP